MLEYMDDVLGRLFDYVEGSPLRDNTYIMIMGDNGSELFDGERTTEGNLQVCHVPKKKSVWFYSV
jgi:arylsulfatase A-like enzyme